MWKRRRVTAIVLAAGSGNRMGTQENKVYTPLESPGKGRQPLLQYTLEAFDSHPMVDDLILTARPEEMSQLETLIQAMALKKPYRIVPGGETRQVSVRLALEAVKNPVVIVHDGARPLIHPPYITGCLEALSQYDGAILALPVEETLCRIRPAERQPQILRDSIWAVQTPQCFYTKILRRCHQKHEAQPTITDDSCLLELEGYRVGVVRGDPRNIKVTTPFDLPVAEAYLE